MINKVNCVLPYHLDHVNERIKDGYTGHTCGNSFSDPIVSIDCYICYFGRNQYNLCYEWNHNIIRFTDNSLFFRSDITYA